MPTLSIFNFKLLIKPCKRLLLNLFKLPYKKTISIRAFHSQCLGKLGEKRKKRRRKIRRSYYQRRKLMFLRSMFGRRPEDLDEVGELMSMAELRDRGPVSSPITPAYVKMMAGQGLRGGREEGSEVDEACRSFENYLVEMIVEEGKVRDLMDVEELLSSWNSLKSPVFVDLVSRFYGELCKDLFSHRDHDQYLSHELLQHDHV